MLSEEDFGICNDGILKEFWHVDFLIEEERLKKLGIS